MVNHESLAGGTIGTIVSALSINVDNLHSIESIIAIVCTLLGLLITIITSIIIPLIWFISNIIGGFVFKRIYIFIIYLVSILFVLNFKIPKLKGKAYIVVAVIAIIGLGLIVWL